MLGIGFVGVWSCQFFSVVGVIGCVLAWLFSVGWVVLWLVFALSPHCPLFRWVFRFGARVLVLLQVFILLCFVWVVAFLAWVVGVPLVFLCFPFVFISCAVPFGSSLL